MVIDLRSFSISQSLELTMKILFTVVSLLITSIAHAEGTHNGSVLSNEISTRGVFIGSSKDEVIGALVPVDSISTDAWESSGIVTTIESNGIKVQMNDEWGILNLKCSANCLTSFGVDIGGSTKQIIQALGEPSRIYENVWSYYFCNEHGCFDAQFKVHFKNNVVDMFEYWVDYV